jgi:hypothetical protein
MGLFQRPADILFITSISRADGNLCIRNCIRDLAPRSPKRLLASAHDDDARAISGQRPRAGRADAAAASGYKSGLACERSGTHWADLN